jgi:hypothetical protein
MNQSPIFINMIISLSSYFDIGLAEWILCDIALVGYVE